MTILDTKEFWYPELWIVLVLIALLISSFVTMALSYKNKNFVVATFLLDVATIACLVMIFCGTFSYLHHREHIAQLDDTATVNELFKTYDTVILEYANIYKLVEMLV